MKSDIKLPTDESIEITGVTLDGVVDNITLNGDVMTSNMKSLGVKCDTLGVAASGSSKFKANNVSIADNSGNEIRLYSEHFFIEGNKIDIGKKDTPDVLKGITVATDLYCHGKFLIGHPDIKTPKPKMALQRSDKDELVINESGSFTGGVKIDGVVNVTDLTVQKHLLLPVGSTLLLQLPPSLPPKHLNNSIDVLKTIVNLQGIIAKLQDRVQILEKKIQP